MHATLEIDGLLVLVRETHGETAVYIQEGNDAPYMAGEIGRSHYSAYCCMSFVSDSLTDQTKAIEAIVKHYLEHRNDPEPVRVNNHVPVFFRHSTTLDVRMEPDTKPIRPRLRSSEIRSGRLIRG